MEVEFTSFDILVSESGAEILIGDQILALNNYTLENLYDFLKITPDELDAYPNLRKIVENHIIQEIYENKIKMVSGEIFDYIQNQEVDGIKLGNAYEIEGITYIDFDGILLTANDRLELERYLERERENAEGIVEIKGKSGTRTKIYTRQIREKETKPKEPKKAPSKSISSKQRSERDYMIAKRMQKFAAPAEAQRVVVPPIPKRFQEIPAEEKARRMQNYKNQEKVSDNFVVSDAIMNVCFPQKKKLRDYQIHAVRHILRNRAQIAVHSVGSGKTLVAATAAVCALKHDPNLRVIFISPKSLKTNFMRTLEDSFDDVDFSRIMLYTYEKFRIDHNQGLIDCAKIFLIIDEAHKLRTKYTEGMMYTGKVADLPESTVGTILKCARKASKVLLLTATPVVNEPHDIANLVAIARGELVGLDLKTFKRQIFDYPRGQAIEKKQFVPKKGPNFDAYFKNLFTFYVRPHDDTYPKVEFHRVEIPMSQRYYNEYMRVEKQILSSMQTDVLGEGDLEPFYNGIRRTVNADIDELNPKLSWVREHLLKYNNRKMVIFSPFISLGIRQLEILVKDFDVKPEIGEITGGDSESQRQSVIDRFNSDKIQVLLISIGAGGLGINLIGARDEVMMQPGWNEVEMQQAMGRAIRFHSHTHLPLNERKVDVWQLLLVKPPGHQNENPSADLIVERITQRKTRIIGPFMEMLEKTSK